MSKAKVSLSVKTPDGKVQKLADDINNLSPEGKAAAVAALDALNAAPAAEPVDLFQWANNTDAYKNELELELFIFNKNTTPYTLQAGPELKHKLLALFVYDIINVVQMGAATGLQVRNYIEAEKDDVALLVRDSADRTTWRADTLLHLIEKERHDIIEFNADEHDYKRQKGLVLRCVAPGGQVFHVIKQFKPGAAVEGGKDFVLQKDRVRQFDQDLAFKIDPGNQILAVDNSLFIFSQAKYEAVFDTKPHAIAQARKNGQRIDQLFKLSMPLTVQEIAIMAESSKSAMKKLAEVNPDLKTQEEVLEAADEFAIELMTDDNGAIILMDGADVVTFLDILLDNYVHGSTGIPYVAKTKKPLEEGEE